jgi:hypothetical protein
LKNFLPESGGKPLFISQIFPYTRYAYLVQSDRLLEKYKVQSDTDASLFSKNFEKKIK